MQRCYSWKCALFGLTLKAFFQAYKHQEACVEAFLRIFKNLTRSWLPVLKRLLIDLRKLGAQVSARTIYTHNTVCVFVCVIVKARPKAPVFYDASTDRLIKSCEDRGGGLTQPSSRVRGASCGRCSRRNCETKTMKRMSPAQTAPFLSRISATRHNRMLVNLICNLI